MPRHIAFFGSSLLSAYWNGAATYYRGIIKALSQNGFRTTFFEPDAYGRQENRDLEPPEWAEVRVYPAACEEGVRRALEEAEGADIVIKASGVGVFDALLEEAVAALRRPGRLACFWDVDAPATLARLAADPADPFRARIPEYDLILTYGGGEPVTRAYEALGARACVPVYNGLDPDSHHPVPPRPEFACDLAFLGNRLPDREARVESFFLAPAAALPESMFLLGGNGWADKPLPGNVRLLGHVPTRDHNALNSSARIVLNIARDSMAATGFSPATRVFEAAGAGACLVTDAWAGIEHFFEPGREILVAESGEAVADHCGRLTAEDAARVGRAALRRALAEHTYDRRVQTLIPLIA